MDQATDTHQDKQEVVKIAIKRGAWYIAGKIETSYNKHFHNRMAKAKHKIKGSKTSIE